VRRSVALIIGVTPAGEKLNGRYIWLVRRDFRVDGSR
jgi:hypothetical protein